VPKYDHAVDSGSRSRNHLPRSIVLTVIVFLTTLALHGQIARGRVDVSTLGPQVGEAVPDFTLPDQTGRARNLSSIMGARGAMLVFLRSADW
jgi:hypothetical protein